MKLFGAGFVLGMVCGGAVIYMRVALMERIAAFFKKTADQESSKS